MADLGRNLSKIAVPIFAEQTVADHTVYFTDVVPLNNVDKLSYTITSSGTVDGLFTLEMRDRPAPVIGVWPNQDDGYWKHAEAVTISGAQGNGVKQVDCDSISYLNSAQVRFKMSIQSGGTLGVWVTVKE